KDLTPVTVILDGWIQILLSNIYKHYRYLEFRIFHPKNTGNIFHTRTTNTTITNWILSDVEYLEVLTKSSVT
ncbi:hypothetical protein L9F63_024465, partial [Diploptera punctata]